MAFARRYDYKASVENLNLLSQGKGYENPGNVEYPPFAKPVALIKNRQLHAPLRSADLGPFAKPGFAVMTTPVRS